MTKEVRTLSNRIFLILSGIFIASLVVSNLIFQKFFSWNPLGLFNFELSVGIIPYPITFLITDIISEIYGKKKATDVVIAGLFASLFVLVIIWIADATPAIDKSPLDNKTFSKVFNFTTIAVAASMIAYLGAQFIDVRIYHFWKKLTNGKKMWLRNNASTFCSQITDTSVVLILLCYFNVLEWSSFWTLFISGILFKIIVAVIDTPLLYLATYYIRKKLNLKFGQEVQ
jgi:uncharacterized integral membrane protein (TIGR00697 family)